MSIPPQHGPVGFGMSRDAGDDVPTWPDRRVHLAINLGSPEEVDGYTSIVADPDGHAWELALNPGWPLDADGLTQLH